MGILFANNVNMQLAADLAADDTSFSVIAGQGSQCPEIAADSTDYMLLKIRNKNGLDEIVKIIEHELNSDTFIIGDSTEVPHTPSTDGRAYEKTFGGYQTALAIKASDAHKITMPVTAATLKEALAFSDVTATVAELSQLHESGIMKADLEKLHAITASAVNINALTALLDADNRTVGDIITKTSAGTMGAIAAVAVGSYLKSAGVGELPAWGKMSLGDTGVAVDNFTFTSTGSLSITGVGFKPSLVIFFGVYEDTLSFGVSTASKSRSVRIVLGTDNATRSSGYCFSLGDNTGIADVIATLTSMDSDGFTLNVSKVSGTANVSYIAFP